MASTYTTGFGIEKIGDGEQAGAWGTTTNHNLDILDRIASYKAVALSGTTHTLTIREASPESGTENLQDGMYRVIKFTGALGANNTVTIAPNTSPAWFIVENATTDSGSSGPYSVILTQGSGANVTVLNGKNAAIFCDGAGSGAVIYNALADLQVATLTAETAVVPDASDGATLGSATLEWADAYFADGAIIYFGDDQEISIAHTADVGLTVNGALHVAGTVTATGTVEPAGDTAASDNAAIGYTSAEGLILTGQGSTNDVTIKNDADADVITIATGGTNVDIVGDVTASTVNADGDTAASDNAAMGYTSAEGLILTGQGSTNDVTIKNDADADVITIATGGTNVDIVGDVTASTVNADGDTAASDNAAMGYTAAEGLILTGQGSTSDVTIKNDADADVIKIPTGTTNVTIVGDLTVNGVIFDDETLDIYDEGTWSPTIRPYSVVFDSVTYDSLRYGAYVIIGHLCHFEWAMRTDAITVGSGSGDINVAGLPVAPLAVSNFYRPYHIHSLTGFAGEFPAQFSIASSNLLGALQYSADTTAGWTATAIADLGTGADANWCICVGTYETA